MFKEYSIFYDPEYAAALQAAVDNKIPIHGQIRQSVVPTSTHCVETATFPFFNLQLQPKITPVKTTFILPSWQPQLQSPVLSKAKAKRRSKQRPAAPTTEAVAVARTKDQDGLLEISEEGKLALRREKTMVRQVESRKKKKQRTSGPDVDGTGLVIQSGGDRKVDASTDANPPDPAPKFENDFGNDPEGPNANAIVVSWMADVGNIERFKKSDVASKKVMMDEIQESLRERGIPMHTNDKSIAKLEEVLRNRHSVNPLALHESTGLVSKTERQSLVDLLLRPCESDEEEGLSDTELDEGAPIKSVRRPSAGPSRQTRTVVDLTQPAKDKTTKMTDKNDTAPKQGSCKNSPPYPAVPVVDFTQSHNASQGDVKPIVQQNKGKKTGAVARPTVQPGDTVNAAAHRKPKVKEEINKTVADRFDNHLEHIKVRDQKLDEHISLRDEQERESLETNLGKCGQFSSILK
ncbi:hypothetical protein QFC22_002420 [Naganishia vaughanmartiniae]|uniref:Uncharacterized protein n=1 Tax=Naganishia vaughanmartiniae TaxID=1424756 RepID=A0ACC2XEV5_9TREE|nr:hypothetical protein QFC22_002420 [Naganishia vaughanmartiniae]